MDCSHTVNHLDFQCLGVRWAYHASFSIYAIFIHILRRHVERTKLHFLPHRNELSLALPHGGSGGIFDGFWRMGLLESVGKFWESTVWLIRIYPNSSRSMHTGAIGCPPTAAQKISGPGFVSSGKFRQVWPWCRMAVHQHDTEAEGVPFFKVPLAEMPASCGIHQWVHFMSFFFGSNGISKNHKEGQHRSTRLENVDLCWPILWWS